MEKSKNNKREFLLALLGAFLLLGIFSIAFASAEANYCCEKTLSGASCQNDVQANCDPSFKIAPTSCDSTSYCKKGCCYDSQEGLCMESTPQVTCESSGGTWANNAQCDIPQCNLGCCVLADQGALVTLARCKSLSGFYQLTTDFRKNIKDEVVCIATAGAEEKGACVYEDTTTFQKTCKFTTRANCKESAAIVDINSTTISNKSTASGFYRNILCSAEELGTNCGPSTKTTLVDGKDEIYFTDTCGNVANIYDASRYNDQEYWKKVYKKSESCGYGSSNAKSSSCGNCDYMAGSIGKPATGILGRPTYGSFICVDLSCKSQGKKHGESWCLTDSPSGNGKDTVGSLYYREICLNNEIITEPCANYRNEICISGNFNGFSEAACRVNRWQDCTSQVEKADCENTDQRDCKWTSGFYFSANTMQIEKSTNDTNGDGNLDDPTVGGLCTPNYPPGFNFWGDSEVSTTGSATSFKSTTNSSPLGTGAVSPSSTKGTTGSESCSTGNTKVAINWEKVTKLWPMKSEDWECAKGSKGDACRKYDADPKKAEITSEEAQALAKDMNAICSTLGDCGAKTNWVGKYTSDGYAAYLNNKRIAGAGGAEVLEKASTDTAGSSAGSPGITPSSAKSGLPATGNVIQGRIILDYLKAVVNGEN